jgi:hypothetical protein
MQKVSGIKKYRPGWVIPVFIVLQILQVSAQTVDFDSSSLPIVVIDTHGQTIVNSSKITADMGIIYNGAGEWNYTSDPWNDYDGKIGIELRGSSSQQFPKKQYAVETRDSLGNNLSASLLGMPAENDWILYAVYNDKSLMRDVLAFKISNDLGMYGSRSRYCELVLNGDYRGVYILLEKIKRDNDRVDIATLDLDDVSGDSLTGGYIIKIDKWDGEENAGWPSAYKSVTGSTIYYQYHYPRPVDIQTEQKNYIQRYIAVVESLLAGPQWADPFSGYRHYINVESFVDYFLQVELAKNVDGFRLSAFMYKDRDDNDPRWTMGPIWDYTISYGNADYYNAQYSSGWWIDDFEIVGRGDYSQIPFYWKKLRGDPYFADRVNCRWQELRQTCLSLDYLNDVIDSLAATLDGPQQRNFQKWPILNNSPYVWPCPPVSDESYAGHVAYLKTWLAARIAWMDQNMIGSCTSATGRQETDYPGDFQLFQNYPNPFNATTTIQFRLDRGDYVKLGIYDLAGREIKRLLSENMTAGIHSVHFAAQELPSGVYFYQVKMRNLQMIQKMILIK